MKKLLAFLLALILIFGITACGAENSETSEPDTNENQTTESPADNLIPFFRSTQIESKVIYEGAGLKISVDKLEIDEENVNLFFTVENSNDETKTVSLYSGAVNGYMSSPVYKNKVEAKTKNQKALTFSIKDLHAMGITIITDFEVGFEHYGNDFKSTAIDPIPLETTGNGTAFENKSFEEIFTDKSVEKDLGIKINHFEIKESFNKKGVQILSSAFVADADGKLYLVLEIKNNNDYAIFTQMKEIHFDNVEVYHSLWSAMRINAGKTGLEFISVEKLTEKYLEKNEGDTSKISPINSITFDFGISKDGSTSLVSDEHVTIGTSGVLIP